MVDVEEATALWRRCLRRPSRALPALEALVSVVASEPGPIPYRPQNHRCRRHPCTTGLDFALFQTGEMNIEMPFQDGRKLFHNRMSFLASELRWIWRWSLLKICIQNGSNPGLSMGTAFGILKFRSEDWIGTILNADFRPSWLLFQMC